MADKKRVLWCGEATYLETGYAKYGREVLGRLHETGKYDIAEFSSYGHWSDVRKFSIPWKYYGNMPNENPEEHSVYYGNPINAFGAWRFEDVLLDFKPDVVIDIRDWWMSEHQERSPFRRFFHWAIMPTIDSAPQQEEWLNTYLKADSVFAYSEYGLKVMEEEGNGLINTLGTCPPGAHIEVFKPVVSKAEHRDRLGLEENVRIVGTIMRNQKRKLYPDLIESFKIYMENHPEQAKDTYLYLHTSYPDIGWDIPALVRESGISHKILFSYVCSMCTHTFPAFFQDARMACPACGNPSAFLPNYQVGADEGQLAGIINLFDLYVQYSVCEGFGMPQVEAAACAVPFCAVNYSAMESILKNLKGMPINVERFFREAESGAFRALPNNRHLAETIYKFFEKPEPLRIKAGMDSMLGVKQHYTWKKTAAKWEKFLDGVDVNEKESWDSAPRVFNPVMEIPGNLSNDDFVKWGILNICGRQELMDSYMALRMMRDLNYGKYIDGGHHDLYYNDLASLTGQTNLSNFTQQVAADKLYHMAGQANYWEKRRAGFIQEAIPEFIQQAKEAYDDYE